MDSLPKRKQNRLTGYDYSQPGCYFVTFCVVDRLLLLRQNMPALCRGAQCAPASGFPPLTYAGKMIDQAIRGIASHYQNITVDKYVIMPNHVHLLLCIRGSENNGRTMCAPTKNVSIAHVIKMVKEVVTKSIGYSIWQKGYHDHIIRSEADYLRIWDYIDTNPAKWREDCYYCQAERTILP